MTPKSVSQCGAEADQFGKQFLQQLQRKQNNQSIFLHNTGLQANLYVQVNSYKKAKGIKRATLIANLVMCNLAVGYTIPKIQYIVREKRTGTKMAPGHEQYALMEKEMEDRNIS